MTFQSRDHLTHLIWGLDLTPPNWYKLQGRKYVHYIPHETKIDKYEQFFAQLQQRGVLFSFIQFCNFSVIKNIIRTFLIRRLHTHLMNTFNGTFNCSIKLFSLLVCKAFIRIQFQTINKKVPNAADLINVIYVIWKY